MPNADPYPEIPRFAKSGGQTQAELEAKLATISGLTFEHSSGTRPNAKGNTGYGYRFTVAPDHRIADPVALVNYLVESAWSVRDGYMPNTSVEFTLSGAPEDGLDLTSVAQNAGWISEDANNHRGVRDNGVTFASVWVGAGAPSSVQDSVEANRERLGKWPGDAPDVPENLVVPR
ncbi:hypothetical protein [Mycetocola lacteus]|uniref:hypothetical protein n=1 Tax=Mycetocola lacteus TaxID=76637 RepID=UPI0011C44861|nr:hypothetical protein [Mycetocola lacteus]